jgi:predicted ATP-dependent serine protease
MSVLKKYTCLNCGEENDYWTLCAACEAEAEARDNTNTVKTDESKYIGGMYE